MLIKQKDKDEVNKGLRLLLGNPVLYTLFGQLMGLSNKYKMYIDKFIKPFPKMKILDIGCGTAAILDYLPLNIEYSGYDINPVYIKYAKKKYGNRATFHNMRVSEMVSMQTEPFDVVLADSLLHHLNNDEAKDLFHTGYTLLKDKGFMLTIDPVLIEHQNFISKTFCALDRGQHVRSPDKYKEFAQSSFKFIEFNLFKNTGILPLWGCLLKCTKK
jgi:2-polyprenyl-3-methyl-5-hydroxy-6-metoxy-1,4-benzoquinol methylase